MTRRAQAVRGEVRGSHGVPAASGAGRVRDGGGL